MEQIYKVYYQYRGRSAWTVERGSQEVWLGVGQTDSVGKGISGFGKSFWKEREALKQGVMFSKWRVKCEGGCGQWGDNILVANIYWLLTRYCANHYLDCFM